VADISLETEYPFKNQFLYRIEAKQDFKFVVRIPSFAKDIVVDGIKVTGTEQLVFDVKENENREIRIEYEIVPTFVDRPYELKTVKCGSLLFSLPIKYERVMYEYERNCVERKYPYCDYEYVGKTDWNYGYSSEELEIVLNEINEIPFSSENPPIVMKAKMIRIDWGLEDGYDTVCAKVPESRKAIGETETIELYPYGCAKLRMTEMPMIKE